jgi:eukaryotic-like serine/threonine-protein kinase
MMQRYCPKCFKRFDDDLARCPDDGDKLVLVAEQDLVGKLLDDRYRILSKLGEGGMGTVYIAEQAMIGRKVALKVLRGAAVQDESSVKRFLTEAKAIASLKSAHTVTLHDFGVTAEGLLYYTMELLEGAPLSDVIKADAPMDWVRASKILLQACKSLEEAHDKGILHRDIKPDNLFITWDTDGEHCTVLDFGIAKLADGTVGTITKTGMICGTPAYLSPEQAQGYEARKASDLYSLGIVFYEMLAGEPPFSDTTAMRVLMAHVGEEAKPVSVKNPDVQVPESIDQFVRHVMQKNPADRHQDVPEFRRSLNAAMEAASMEGTVSLPALGTHADGMREITSDFGVVDEPPSASSVDPMAGTMLTPSAELDAVKLATAETAAIQPITTPAATIPSFPDDDFPGTDTAALVQETRGRGGLWIGVIVGVIIAAALGIWRPWEMRSGAAPSAAEPPVTQEAPAPAEAADAATTSPSGPEVIVASPVSDVVEAPAEDLRVAATPVPAPDVVDVTPAEDLLVAGAPTIDLVAQDIAPAPAPDEAEAAASAAAASAAKTTAAADAAAEAMEAEQLAAEKLSAEEERKKSLARDRRAAARKAAAAKKAAEEAAAEKKAAQEALAKKAAAEAAAAKAAAEAAAKKAAEAAKPGLGFRKVTVEDPKPEEPPKDPGIGFRKVNVEEK